MEAQILKMYYFSRISKCNRIIEFGHKLRKEIEMQFDTFLVIHESILILRKQNIDFPTEMIHIPEATVNSIFKTLISKWNFTVTIIW